ncbi:MAG: helix-turn-helix transcriptional regulator [Prosthecobacter sp.]
MPATHQQTISNTELLTKEQLAECLNLPSTRMVGELMRKRRIPYIKLGHKTVRFRLSAVMEAISRLEVHAVK